MARIFISCLVLFAVCYAAEPPAELIVSSNNSYWQTGTVTTVTDDTANVIVDLSSVNQNWEGFGGTFNEMGWDALSEINSEIPKAMELLFDDENGANFMYGRIPIGASDYAMSWYSLAETANDYAMDRFSIARDREKLIPYIKAALAVNPELHLWGSPWICPDWMKSGSNFKNDPQTMEAYALYFAKFVEEYGKEGLTIEAVHHQNEPGYARVKWTTPQFVSFLGEYLGPKFEERNVSAEIWCGTMSHPLDSNIAIACMNDAEAMKYIKGFGLQWNLESVVPTLSKKGRVWQTEHRCGNYNFETKYWDQSRYSSSKPQNDHLYGVESWQLLRDWIAAGVHSYCAWNMVLDTYGKSLDNWPQNALLVVDRSAKKLIITPAYWTFRHFSQKIMPGAKRIGTLGGHFDALAFKNPDGTYITQVLNKEDAAKKITVNLGGTLYQFNLPGQGWATLSAKPSTSAEAPHLNQSVSSSNTIRITGARDNFRISLSSGASGHLELVTVDGRVLDSKPITQSKREILLSRSALPSGVLLVRFVSGETTTTARLVSAY